MILPFPPASWLTTLPMVLGLSWAGTAAMITLILVCMGLFTLTWSQKLRDGGGMVRKMGRAQSNHQ